MPFVIKVQGAWDKPVKYYQGETNYLAVLTPNLKEAYRFPKLITANSVAKNVFSKGVWEVIRVAD